MPAALSHYQHGLDCLAARPDAAAALGLAGDPGRAGPGAAAFLAGLQGPDPFYFYGRLPWRPRAGVAEAVAAGDHLHGIDPAQLYASLVRAAAGASGGARAIGLGFAAGLLLHYVLDRSVHPWVYYRSGFDADGRLSGAWSAAHARFEAAMAVALWTGRRPGQALPPPGRYLDVPAAALAGADAALAAAAPAVAAPGRYAAAWADMAAVLRLLRDPLGAKAALADAFGAGGSLPRGLMMPPPPKADARTVLNPAGAAWRHPGSGTESTAGVEELYVGAVGLGAAVLDAVAAYGRGAGDPAALAALFDGRNHEGLARGERLTYRAPD
jgi:hypothetical protein